MGHDLVAYSGLKKTDAVFDKSGYPIDPISRNPIDGKIVEFELENNHNFPGRQGDIEFGNVYSYEDCMDVSVGSYQAYSIFREIIARLSGYPLGGYILYGHIEQPSFFASAFETGSGPFWEILAFQDCDCTLGNQACVNIAKSFRDFQEEANLVDSTYIWETYDLLALTDHNESKEDWIKRKNSIVEDFHNNYKNIRKAFELSSYKGAVQLS